MSGNYRISQLARELEVTTRTIRFYEEQGLLTPARRGLERVYSPRDRTVLKLILRGKRIGLSLSECKELIDMYAPSGGNRRQLDHLQEKIAGRRQQLERQLLDIQQMLRELDKAEQHCRNTLVAARDDTPNIDNDNRRLEP